jgi:hypothetical protein
MNIGHVFHGDHMIEIMKASTFEFCGLLRSVKYCLRWIKNEMISDVRLEKSMKY